MIEGKLATRGNGHVYEAIHLVLPRRVVIKVMPAAMGWSRMVALELLREACIVDALDHPGIPRIYECGVMADRRPWTATELVAGTSLATISMEHTPSALETAELVRDVADVLAYAHGRGLVHRGLTPMAIVFPERARRFPIVLSDWSGARTLDSTAPLPMAAPPTVTPYLAPEQQRGDRIDGRADVYSLGVVARALLRRAEVGSVPPVLTALVERMVAASVDGRPDAVEVREHASWLVSELGIEAAFAGVRTGIPEPIDGEKTEVVSHSLPSREARPGRADTVPGGDPRS